MSNQPLALPPESTELADPIRQPEIGDVSRSDFSTSITDEMNATAFSTSITDMADSIIEKAYANLIEALEEVLKEVFPSPPAGLPKPSVTLVNVGEKTVGVGNRIVDQTRGPLSVFALKGRRLDAAIRFQLWASSPDAVEQLTKQLREFIQNQKENLRRTGFIVPAPPNEPNEKAKLLTANFLNLMIANTTLPEHVESPDSWRQSITYQVLYEFRDHDEDEASSLIARIPIEFTGEFNEITVVTDDLVRWDEQEAQSLETRRRGRRVKQINSLVIFAFLPTTFDGDQVTITVSTNGLTQQKSFASLREFQNAFDLEDEKPERPLATLGGNPYRAGVMKFPNADFPDPILLVRGDDLIEVSYGSPSLGTGNDAVVYLRAI